MQLLTDDEIDALWLPDGITKPQMIVRRAVVRAAEKAMLAKLGAMELPEPVCEVTECGVMGQQTLTEIDGRWKFLRYGETLYTSDAMRKAYALGAAAQLAEKPTAWSVTYNGEHTGNFNLKRYDAEDKRDSLNRVYPNDKREVVELYTRREA